MSPEAGPLSALQEPLSAVQEHLCLEVGPGAHLKICDICKGYQRIKNRLVFFQRGGIFEFLDSLDWGLRYLGEGVENCHDGREQPIPLRDGVTFFPRKD